MIRIVIVDDSQIIRETLQTIIGEDPEIQVAGTAANGKEAVELCDRLNPDLVLMDIKMPLCDGVEGTRLIKERYQEIRVLILTTFSDQEYVAAAIQNGADGYVLKDLKETELIRLIKSTVSGFKIVPDIIFESIKKQYAGVPYTAQAPKQQEEFNLTGREREIICLIVDGKANKEIAGELEIAEGTVRNIISTLLAKLQLQDRTQIAVFAIKNNLV